MELYGVCMGFLAEFVCLFSSGPRAYAPDAPQPSDLLCNPLIVLDVPTFSASPSSRPCYPRDPWQRKVELRGRETCPPFTEHLGIFYMPQIYDMRPTALLPLRRKAC